jgi:hypothetical protein
VDDIFRRRLIHALKNRRWESLDAERAAGGRRSVSRRRYGLEGSGLARPPVIRAISESRVRRVLSLSSAERDDQVGIEPTLSQ